MARHKRVLQQLTMDGQPEVVAEIDLSPSWGGRRAGAGRPKAEIETRVLSARIPIALWWRVKIAAGREHLTMADWIKAVLDRATDSSQS